MSTDEQSAKLDEDVCVLLSTVDDSPSLVLDGVRYEYRCISAINFGVYFLIDVTVLSNALSGHHSGECGHS